MKPVQFREPVDEQLLAIARGSKKQRKRPFLTDEDIEGLEERFSAALGALFRPAASPRQAVGRCQVIDLAAWKRGRT